MSRRWPVAVLGLGLAATVISGRTVLFVRPWFIPVVAVTAVLTGLVAFRGGPRLSPTAALLLVLPIAAGLTLTPDLVSRVSSGPVNSATLAARIGDPPNPLLSGRDGSVTLLQILLAQQQAGAVYLAGRTVSVIAIVSGPHELRRSAIVCCSADARSIALRESGPSLPDTGSWVRVTGTLVARGQQTILDARTIDRIPAPSDPFL